MNNCVKCSASINENTRCSVCGFNIKTNDILFLFKSKKIDKNTVDGIYDIQALAHNIIQSEEKYKLLRKGCIHSLKSRDFPSISITIVKIRQILKNLCDTLELIKFHNNNDDLFDLKLKITGALIDLKLIECEYEMISDMLRQSENYLFGVSLLVKQKLKKTDIEKINSLNRLNALLLQIEEN